MPISLSASDIRILNIIQKDANLSTSAIADKVGLSQSPCWRRINYMEQAGLIRGKVYLLDNEKLGMEVVVFTSVNLLIHAGESLQEFERQVATLPEVVECYTMTGNIDYMLKIITKDIRHYEQFVRTHLALIPGIRELHSNVAVTRIKDTTELPLETQL
jgi:Lrp/AsnC family transcriptional regulator